ncbi:EmrB/QacA subfamily drug resistance transporter [Allocatelliglobosispora scoriae]|uniref:EmrB/QacA subfamily drug resistance transporter n=1 Tax=Allocatelliglobosispora scoriae TaxID=643052 RepID=A0A841BWL3_9ACTN|nr:DHA2 family efflux MFS transporter permease subunit [Allocatelliglobosispora scoriae]MBB5872065.1 EmrB/QacA subfamily drug resistance transporter [Allocatelliglobosispora scoriae]
MQTSTSSPRRWWALAALALSVLVVGLDGTVLNVALPTLARDLGAGTDDLQWIIDAYLVVLAALMLPAGLLGDRLGRKKLLLTGLALFLGASLAAAFAGGTAALIAARAAMGIGAAIILPVSMAILPSIFPPDERGRAIAIWTGGTALGLPLGPILGGWLLEHFWWGSVFLINVPVIGLALVMATMLLPESKDPQGRRLDPLGVALAVAGLGGIVFGVIQAPADGWADPTVLATLIGGALALGGFVTLQLRSRQPMVELRLFRQPIFVWGTVSAAFVSLTLVGLLFVTPQYLQVVLGNGAFGTGLRLVPLIGGLLVGGLASERLTKRLGVRTVVSAGMLVLAAGFALGAQTTTTGGYAEAARWLTVVGLGIGLTLPPIMDAVLAAVPEEQAGAGSGLLQALRQVGGALGVATLGSLLSFAYARDLDTSGLPAQAATAAEDSITGAVAVAQRLGDQALLSSAQAAFIHGMNVVLVASAIGAVLGAILIAVFMPGRPAPTPAASENGTHELSRTP